MWLHDQRRQSMAETHLNDLTKKCLDIWNKIGRPKNNRDERLVIVYSVLSEYVKTIEADILQEPGYITARNGDAIENPNRQILEAIKEEIRNIDKELRLSFWPTDKGRG